MGYKIANIRSLDIREVRVRAERIAILCFDVSHHGACVAQSLQVFLAGVYTHTHCWRHESAPFTPRLTYAGKLTRDFLCTSAYRPLQSSIRN